MALAENPANATSKNPRLRMIRLILAVPVLFALGFALSALDCRRAEAM